MNDLTQLQQSDCHQSDLTINERCPRVRLQPLESRWLEYRNCSCRSIPCKSSSSKCCEPLKSMGIRSGSSYAIQNSSSSVRRQSYARHHFRVPSDGSVSLQYSSTKDIPLTFCKSERTARTVPSTSSKSSVSLPEPCLEGRCYSGIDSCMRLNSILCTHHCAVNGVRNFSTHRRSSSIRKKQGYTSNFRPIPSMPKFLRNGKIYGYYGSTGSCF